MTKNCEKYNAILSHSVAWKVLHAPSEISSHVHYLIHSTVAESADSDNIFSGRIPLSNYTLKFVMHARFH